MRVLHLFSASQSVFYFMDGQLQYMLPNGCEMHVVMPKDEIYSPQLIKRETGIHFHFVSLKRKISLLNDIKNLFQIYLLLLKVKPDILHLHTPKASFIGALAGRLTFQKNIIYQMHGLVSSDGISVKKNLIYFLEKYTCYFSKNIFAVSPSLKEFAIENNYCSEDKINVIGNGTINGIDWKKRFNRKNLEGEDKYLSAIDLQGKFVIGFVGRINKDKGIEDFLRVVSDLAGKIPLAAIIVGENEMAEQFDELLNRYKINEKDVKLMIFGQVHDPERIMCHFDVLVFPTKREGFGLVAAEANALGVPVVAYDIPGVKDAIENNVTGRLVPYGDLNRLEDAVFQYYINEKGKKEHGLNGRKRVQKLFCQEELWKNILATYKSLTIK